MELIKIPIYEHVIEREEENLSKTSHLLNILSKKCAKIGDEMQEKSVENYDLTGKVDDFILEVGEFLYEIGYTMEFISENLESREEFLREMRIRLVSEIESNIKPELKLAA